MKYESSIRKQCKDCQIVKRRGKLKIICKNDPKHKRTQG